MKYDGKELTEAMDMLHDVWKREVADTVIGLCLDNPIDKPLEEFLKDCTACGGDWGNMLLTGIKKLRPEIYDAIPDQIGRNGIQAFVIICNVLYLLKVKSEE